MISYTSTPFELIIEALLDDGNAVHLEKEDGVISLTLNDDTVTIGAITLEEIGQLMLGSAISQAYKRIDGGTGEEKPSE